MQKKTNFLNRREFLIGSSLSATCISSVLSKNINKKAHIVIVGGGWGGLSAAKALRSLNKECNITLIEKQKYFISCPISNWVIGQIKLMKDISFSYDKFRKNNNINMLFDEVQYIDINKKNIKTKETKFDFDKLILSPGIHLDYSSIEGFKNTNDISLFTAWKAGNETKSLANRVKNLQNNDNVVITIPMSPYRFPRAPTLPEQIQILKGFV